MSHVTIDEIVAAIANGEFNRRYRIVSAARPDLWAAPRARVSIAPQQPISTDAPGVAALTNELWEFIRTPDGAFFLRNVGTVRFASSPQPAYVGGPVIEGSNVPWTINVNHSDRTHTIALRGQDLHWTFTGDGQQIEMLPPDNGTTQKWYFELGSL